MSNSVTEGRSTVRDRNSVEDHGTSDSVNGIYGRFAQALTSTTEERVGADFAPASMLAAGGASGAWASHGDAGDGEAPDIGTVFRIASCTKSFTAARALQLRDAGELNLDRPITELLPAFPRLLLPTPDSPIPTPRMLLTMSAGLPTDDAWADRLEAMPRGDFDALLARGIRFSSVPGTRYEYANLGWAILGRIMEHIDGRSLQTQLEVEVLDALGLSGVRFTKPQGRRIAAGYAKRAHGWEPQPTTGPGAFSAIGGLFASCDDLLTWAAWLAAAFNPRSDRAHEDVLSPASRREMQQLHRFDQSAAPEVRRGYGYGLVVEHSAEFGHVVGHSGGYPGYSAHMRWSVEQPVAICGFENGGYTGVFRPVHAVFNELMREVRSRADKPGRQRHDDLFGDPDPDPSPWPETRKAAARISSLVNDAGNTDALWEQATEDLFDACIGLDQPFAERRAELANLVNAVAAGIAGVARSRAGDTALRHHDPVFPTPARAEWRVSGARGTMTVAIEMTPTEPPRVQRFTIAALDTEATP